MNEGWCQEETEREREIGIDKLSTKRNGRKNERPGELSVKFLSNVTEYAKKLSFKTKIYFPNYELMFS